jgi:hypothetical protein
LNSNSLTIAIQNEGRWSSVSLERALGILDAIENPPESLSFEDIEYCGQSTEELLAMVSSHDKFRVVEAVHGGVAQKQRDGPCLWSEEGQVLYWSLRNEGETELTELLSLFASEIMMVVLMFDGEVRNGGFSLFLTNSSGVYAPVIVSILQLLDCPKTIAITAAALAARPHGWEELDSRLLSQYLHQFDLEYYQTGEDLFDAMYDFIAAHPDGFRLP